MLGLGIQPEAYDPMVTLIDPRELLAHFARVPCLHRPDGGGHAHACPISSVPCALTSHGQGLIPFLQNPDDPKEIH